MKLRYGDKPLEDYEKNLSYYENKNFKATLKVDGWRTHVARDKSATIARPEWGQGKDKSLFFLSRRDKAKGGPTQIPVCKEIVESFEALDLPDLSMVDTEWMARRTIGECPEKIFAFGLLWWKDEWLGNSIQADRDSRLVDALGGRLTSTLDVPAGCSGGFVDFFNQTKLIPWSEGIVLKNTSSRLKGGWEKSEKNPLWIKIKYRSGESSRDECKIV